VALYGPVCSSSLRVFFCVVHFGSFADVGATWVESEMRSKADMSDATGDFHRIAASSRAPWRRVPI
jgi:hypothetical protein